MTNISSSLSTWIGIVSLLALKTMCAASSTEAACYGTQREAIDALTTNSSFSPFIKKGGYRVTRIEFDPVLGLRWAMIARCDHPEWPAVALPANTANSVASLQLRDLSVTDRIGTAPVVRAGDIVRLWKQESFLRIEVAGVCEESGGVGKTIRVRLMHRNADDQSIPEQFSGIIRGPSDVEMQSK